MRRLWVFFLVAAIPLALPAQQESSAPGPRDGGASEVLQSIYIPPLHDSPFSATVHTEWARPLAGGGTSTIVNQRKVVRDRDGRIYQERWLLVPKNGKIPSEMNLVQIYDPNQHTGYDCFMLGRQKGYCDLRSYAGVVRKEVPAKRGSIAHEDLGTRMIEGFETIGSRDTTVVNAGVMGNDEPMRIVREFWHSAKLGINLLSILSDPRIGTQTFTLTDVEVTEPDPRFFELPESFQVIDSRQQDDLPKATQN